MGPSESRPASHTVMSSRTALRTSPSTDRASQVPRLTFPHAPSPIIPGDPMSAYAHFFPTGIGLRHLWKVGHTPLCVTRPKRVRLRYGSCVRHGVIPPGITPTGASTQRLLPYAARLPTWRTSTYHGNYLSSYKVGQAYPDAPEITEVESLSFYTRGQTIRVSPCKSVFYYRPRMTQINTVQYESIFCQQPVCVFTNSHYKHNPLTF